MSSYWYKILNFLFFIVLFKVFVNTPLYIIDKVVSLLAILISCFFISRKFLFQKNYFYSTSRKLISIFLILSFSSIFISKYFFAQSFSDSFSANLSTFELIILAFYAY